VQSRFTEIAVNSDCDQGTKLGELYPAVINFIHEILQAVWIVAKDLSHFSPYLSIVLFRNYTNLGLYTKSTTVKCIY